jgi:SPX domain protein involved in polyphosphate accumulation
MGIEVFNRYEKKFLLTNDTYQQFLQLMQPYMKMDAYNQANGFYTISNIYYDTPSDELIRKSLDKPLYKEKLRLRAYGVPDADDHVYLEIKKKYKGLVNKRRTDMVLKEAHTYLESKEMPALRPYHNRQVLNEIQYIISRYNLEPAVYIAYDRKAYFGDGLRITFDTNIRTRRYDLRLDAGDYGEPLLEKGQWLMEIKAENAMPLWLTHVLADLKIFPTSFSKYGTEYQKKYPEGGNISCLNPFLLAHQASVSL